MNNVVLLITILNEGRSYDKDNCAFIIHIFSHYIYLKEYDKADNVLGILFDMPDFDWLYKFMIHRKDSIHIYKTFVAHTLKYSKIKYQNISYMAAKISIDTKLPKNRIFQYIQNYLLGLKINHRSKYLLNYYIDIAEKLNISINQINSQVEITAKNDSYLKSELENKKIDLKNQIDINRSNEILLQNIKSENQKLQKLNADLSLAYNAAKSNAKNYLSYKLGQALIKASKNWYKGGYIKFIFEAIKITKEHKKRCK